MDIQEQFNLVANSYDENRKKFISCFDDYYISSTDFIARTLKYDPKLIYDLGSGTGLLPSFWYKHFPKSEYVLIDIAEEMLDVAKKRFSGIENIKYKVLDYSESMPEGNPDMIISALSIHHLEANSKKRLFKKVYESLEDGRLFVNYDQFCSDSPVINEKIEEYWIDEIKKSGISAIEYERWLERKKLDREISINQEIQWLKDAGFRNVECIYSKGKFGVIVSIK
ncbi:MAG: methyltransferase domain-containing protein [Treponema sp.]|uniref:class I SAM-dependent methyltransferase n=1 Tax=Treponema sp. TaxID=166 RepID=UPI0025EE048A|nr:class I SAM-dependent methyltransferase [Treponema sp.]MBQ9280608.1 methyltransferase domain-containing protein [Treponema sp.]